MFRAMYPEYNVQLSGIMALFGCYLKAKNTLFLFSVCVLKGGENYLTIYTYI